MTPRTNIDIDKIVDYRAEYTAAVSPDKLTLSKDSLLGLCPFHQDRSPSFSVDFKTGKWHCFTEDEGGNFITFWARLHNVDTKTAYKQILEKYGEGQDRHAHTKTEKSYSLEQYSQDKKLPADFLREQCRTSTGRDRDGTTFLRISYTDTNGDETTYRKRYAKKDFRWKTGSKGKIRLYGEWKLDAIQQTGWAVLVEGESDTQSLWYMGLPAVGVPGAALFQPSQAELLRGLKLYVHKEPDQGGDTFTAKIFKTLQDGGFSGEVFQWDCAHLGAKDPSDVYLAHGKDEGRRLIREALDAASPVDLAATSPSPLPDAPVSLRAPDPWDYSENGIFLTDPKTLDQTCICRSPILLTKRLKNLETGEEKIEAAFKRDGAWITAVFPRDTLFSSRNVLSLARLGCPVTSENARQIVSFLGALESENIDRLPMKDATSSFGWHSGGRFLPGAGGDLALDVDGSQKPLAAAYHQNGTLEGWLAAMSPHRTRHKFRFILAASFAAPLLRIVKQRIFFVYNWGDSRSGKTAALKAALSAWGDPEQLMVSFYSTVAGLERTAAFYCDLPLGIDERQQMGDKQGLINQLIYLISGGKGKTRAAKNGGLQTTSQWRTVAIGTGEEPIVANTSMNGVGTRVLEIYGAPFSDETAASMMHQQAADNCGWAGPAFIKKLVQTEESQIASAYEQMFSFVRAESQGVNSAHAAGISTVALADALIDTWLFGSPERTAWDNAQRMARRILADQAENPADDVNENAVQFVNDWILSNGSCFGEETKGPRLGFLGKGGDPVYILPSMLNQALTNAGFSYRKVIRYMAEQELITTDTDQNTGKRVFSIVKRFDSRTARVIEFHIGRLTENAACEIEPDDEELPF